MNLVQSKPSVWELLLLAALAFVCAKVGIWIMS
jgi:hypothetical protein